MSDVTPEERVRRVKAALAEAGYPDADVEWCDRGVRLWTGPGPRSWVPAEVGWRAVAVVGEPAGCWPCVRDRGARSCDHDPMTSPWPEVVR